MTHTERINAAMNELNASLAAAFEDGAKVAWEIGEDDGPIVAVVTWPTSDFCRCEGHDGSFAGYICDECKREIPTASIQSDFCDFRED